MVALLRIGREARLAGEAAVPFTTFHDAEVDGVPVRWAETPGPLTAGLVFGVGRAHETLATAGLSHLVEHLSLSVVDDVDHPYNGMVDQTSTSFVATGTPEEVTAFFATVTSALAGLPLDRLETEQRILLTEEAARVPSYFDALTRIRFGARAHALAGLPELGLRRITPDEVAAWAKGRFVAGAARAWLTGPPPEDLSFAALPAGETYGQPDVVVSGRGTGPAFLGSPRDGCAFSMLAERSVALQAAMVTLADRAQRDLRHERGLIYQLAHWHDILSSRDVHVLLGIDPLLDRAKEGADAFLNVLDALCEAGPTDEELETYLKRLTTGFEDPNAAAALLVAEAKNLLLGRPVRLPQDVLDEATGLDPAAVAGALRASAGSLLADVPEEVDLSPRLEPMPSLPVEEVTGRVFKPQPLKGRREIEIVLNDDGVMLREHGRGLYLRFEECAALVEHSDGAIALIDVHSRSIQLDLPSVVQGFELRRAIYEKVSDELVIPVEPEARRRASVEEVAARDLQRRWAVEEELVALTGQLEDGEEVRVVAEASRGMSSGLLAVTDRRVLFVLCSRGLHVDEIRREDMDRIEVERDRLTVSATNGKKLKLKDVVPAERARDAAEHLGLRAPRPDQRLLQWQDVRAIVMAVLGLAYALASGGTVGSVLLGGAAILDVWLLGHLSRGLASPHAWLHIAAVVLGAASLVVAFVT